MHVNLNLSRLPHSGRRPSRPTFLDRQASDTSRLSLA